ncbi:MAG: ornithine decarboxylase [Clostridia bacterium]|nr:ornithine decarboxylase [Clostridia bacterium]
MDNDNKSIAGLLAEYAKSDVLPMHMPGHKRNMLGADYLSVPAASVDITEIDGFDDLGDPRGIIAESERLAASLWGSDVVLYSVNGSTSCVLAAVTAVCREGAPAVVARNCHKSVFHALELSGAVPVFIAPPKTALGLPGSVTPESVRTALEKTPDASAVILTSPTYEGVISDIAGIVSAAHERGVPVIVDEAHGAHLGLFGVFPEGAVRCGADVAIHSLHKTLRSLTQTAALSVSGSLVDRDEIRRRMAMFGTSSPSYLLISSIDGEVRSLLDGRGSSLSRWLGAVTETRKKLGALDNLTVPDLSEDPAAFAADPSKIYIDSHGVGIRGAVIAKVLRNLRVEAEAVYPYGVLAMTGEGDDQKTLRRFSDALFEVDRKIEKREPAVPDKTVFIPERVKTAREALAEKRVRTPLDGAEGTVCAEYIFAYPPGVPIVIPGERIARETVLAIREALDSGIRVVGLEGDSVLTVEN